MEQCGRCTHSTPYHLRSDDLESSFGLVHGLRRGGDHGEELLLHATSTARTTTTRHTMHTMSTRRRCRGALAQAPSSGGAHGVTVAGRERKGDGDTDTRRHEPAGQHGR